MKAGFGFFSICELSIYGIFSLATLGVAINFFLKRISVRESISDLPLAIAFHDNIELIFYAIISTIAVTIPIVLEFFLDLLMNWKSNINDNNERVFVVFIIAVPGILIFFFDRADLPFIFSTMHALQYIGCLGAVLSICNKLVPNHFTFTRMSFVEFFFALGGYISTNGIGTSPTSWQSITVLFLIPLSIGSFIYFVILWLSSLGIHSFQTIHKIKSLSMDEITCLLYITCTLITIVIIPGIAAATFYLSWQYFNLPIILTFIYSLLGFSLFPGCIPGRVARYAHMIAERNVSREQASKRSALRYLSHELRSPLNVVCSGISFILQDLYQYYPHIKSNIMENLKDVHCASESAVSLLDDVLSFEKLEQGLFPLLKKYVLVQDIMTSVIKPLGVFARQKNLQFVQFVDKVIDKSIEVCSLENVEVHVDVRKITQVRRRSLINTITCVFLLINSQPCHVIIT